MCSKEKKRESEDKVELKGWQSSYVRWRFGEGLLDQVMWQWIENLNEVRQQAARLSDESASSKSSTLCQVPGGLSMIRDDTRRLSLAEVDWVRPRLGKRCKETGKKAVSLRILFPMVSTSNFVLSETVSHYWGRGRGWWLSKRGSWEAHSKPIPVTK